MPQPKMLTNPGYKAPKKPGYLGSYNWKAPLVGLTGIFITCVAVTQYLAKTFGYQAALGHPLYGPTQINGQTTWFYPPWDWMEWLIHYGMSPRPSIHKPIMHGFVYGIVGIAVSICIAAVINVFSRRSLLDNTDQIHGSARWATQKEIAEMGLFHDGPASVYVGGFQDNKNHLRYLKHSGPEHVICVAPSGSGKGVGIVVPTLLNWSESVIVYDIKGENWKMTSGFRQAAGQVCLRIEPMSGNGSCFNPLAEVRIGTDREISDAQNLAQMICRTGNESPNEEHWVVTATSLVAGLIIHVCYDAYNRGEIATMKDLRSALTPSPDTVEALQNDAEQDEDESVGARAYYEQIVGDGINGFAHDQAFALDWKSPTGHRTQTHPFVVESLVEMLNREDKEFTGVLSTATKAISLYRDPLIARTVSRSDFRIRDLNNAERPISLYIIVPPSDIDRLTPFVRLLFTMILNRLTEEMDPSKTNKHKLLLLIDEFPSLGKLAIFSKAFAYIRGYGLRAFLIAQDVRQIVDAYGQHENIVSNCDIRIAYAPNQIDTAKTLSEMTGNTTVQRAALSFSGNRVSPLMSNVSAAVEHVQRPLLTPDEVMRMPRPKKQKQPDGSERITESGDMLVFLAGHAPIYGRQILFFKDPEMTHRVNDFKPPAAAYIVEHDDDTGTERILVVKAAPVRTSRLIPQKQAPAPAAPTAPPPQPEAPQDESDQGRDQLGYEMEQDDEEVDQDALLMTAEMDDDDSALDAFAMDQVVADNTVRQPSHAKKEDGNERGI